MSRQEVLRSFEALPTGLVTLPKGLLQQLSGHPAIFAIEGSRHFRPPSALGGMRFEGCEIVMFDGDIHGVAGAFIADAQKNAAGFEQIEGQNIAISQKKLEADTWTSFVAFPKPNLLVVATNRDYLRDVLSRIAGHAGPRALPPGLPEWKYVNATAPVWALRHYDRSQAALDPSSPIGAEKSANFRDDKAIGIAFNLRDDQTATITYLSDSKDALRRMKSGLFPPEGEPESTRNLKIEYSEVAPGAIQGTFTLNQSDAVWYFTFVLIGVLGHAVYV